jgi:NADH-quinone oxidoreductase subunit L
MEPTTLIWLIPVPPLLAFFLIVLLTNRNKAASHTIAILAALTSWALSMTIVIQTFGNLEHLGKEPLGSFVNWLAMGDRWLTVGVLVDPLTVATLFFVGWTVLMIFIYSTGYHNYGQPKGDHDRPGLPPHGTTVSDMHGHVHSVLSVEPNYSRFFAFISLFAFGMFTLVISDNLLTLFVGWEIMGLCSYLLIGFWFAKPSARAAAIKAFITTRVGDVFMLLGIVYLYMITGTLNFRAILYNEEVLKRLAETPAIGGFLGLSAAALISILIFIGTVGKSAQFPLHVWLPDAMEGPTPVSAMIHAATMVSAGVYLVIRTYPIMAAGYHEGGAFTPAMTAMAVIGTFTAIFAATIAVAQNDIKKVLAYSTISQLGFMIGALGIGAYVAAVFHLVTHAFFKALLFLGSGSVIHGMEHGVMHTGNHAVDPQDMFNMGGLRHRMPITFWTFLIGGFALAGFPLVTAGFWSKDEILGHAWEFSLPVFIVLGLAALMTAFYTMRQITLTFLGEPRTEEAAQASESHWSMTTPLVILAFFAVTAGWLGGVFGLLPNFMHEVGATLLEIPAPTPVNVVPVATSLVVALGGLWLGYRVYRGVSKPAEDPFQIALLKNKYYFDEIYDAAFVKPAIWISETLISAFMDRTIIDGLLHMIAAILGEVGSFLRETIDKFINWTGDASASATKWSGGELKRIQTGKVQQYLTIALIVMAGATVLLFWLVINNAGATPR